MGQFPTKHKAAWLVALLAGIVVSALVIVFANPGAHIEWIGRFGIREKVNAWVNEHQMRVELCSAWAIASGLVLWGAMKVVASLVLLRSVSQTIVGVALRWGKASEAVALLSLSSLFYLQLYGYYTDYRFTTLEQLAISVMIAVASVVAAVLCTWFVVALILDGREHANQQDREDQS